MFIIFTDVCRNFDALIIVNPAFSLSAFYLFPSFMEHSSRNGTVFFKVIAAGNSVDCNRNISCLRFAVFVQTVIFSVDCKISGISSGSFCFFHQCTDCFFYTILVVILEYRTCPYPCIFKLLSESRSVRCHCFPFASCIKNRIFFCNKPGFCLILYFCVGRILILSGNILRISICRRSICC